MEFFFTLLILAMFIFLGLKNREYNNRVRFLLITASAMAPLWFFIVWQGAR